MISKVANLATRAVRYLEAGSGKPIVLLHAFPLGAEQWLPQLAKPARGWQLVAPDLRGLGGSDVGFAPGGASVETHAADVLELTAHLEIPPFRLVGVSMGGYVAMAMLRQAPGRVASLVLADTRAAADSPEARAGRDRMMATLERDGAAGVAREMLPKLLGETTRREQPDLVDAIERLILRNGKDGLAAAIQALKERPDSTATVSSVACPTIVIGGDEDVVTPPDECEALAREIPGARFVRIARAGHLSNVEQPEAFSDAMMSFT